MQENQSLLGSGTCHLVDTSFGNALLSNQTEQMPVLATGAAVNYLTVDDNTTIAGVDFSVDGSVTNLIGAAEVNNCNILYNQISPEGAGSISDQVIAFAAEGRIRIVGNTITGLSPMSGVLIDTQANIESRVEAYGNVLDLSSASQFEVVNSGITQNFFENNTTTGSEAYTYLQTDGSSSTLIRNNAYNGDAVTPSGIVIDNSSGTLQTVIEGNQLTLDPGIGFAGIDITGLEMNAKIAKNEVIDAELMFLRGPVESVQSPNLGVTGIEEINGQAAVEVLQPVSFISFE